MFGNHFYHATTRKAVALFGRLFNNLYVIIITYNYNL